MQLLLESVDENQAEIFLPHQKQRNIKACDMVKFLESNLIKYLKTTFNKSLIEAFNLNLNF